MRKNLKAALITAFDLYAFKGGIERYTIQLIQLLKDNRVNVDVYHTGMIDDDAGLHQRLIGKIFSVGQMFYRYDRDYDFLVSNSFYGLGYFPPRIKSYNIYHSTHVAFDKSTEGVISPITSLELTYLCGYLGEMVSGFDRINIAVSEEVGDELKRYYDFKNVKVIESGVDTKLFMPLKDRAVIRKRYFIPNDVFVGLFVGRWDKTKGSDVVENVIKETSDIYWLLVLGSSSENCELGHFKNVKVLEEVPYEEMPNVYNLSDFMFFPSRYEGFGLVIIEAIACGLPVIVGDVGVARKIYKEEPFSVLKLPSFSSKLDKDLISEIIRKIYLLKDNKELAETISKNGVKIVEEHYNFDLWKKRMLEALEIK